jgi:hypothetical protein
MSPEKGSSKDKMTQYNCPNRNETKKQGLEVLHLPVHGGWLPAQRKDNLLSLMTSPREGLGWKSQASILKGIWTPYPGIHNNKI